MPATIDFKYRNDLGTLSDRGAIPYCVECYVSKIHDNNIFWIRHDLKKGIENILELSNLLIDELPKEKNASLLNPYERCNLSIPEKLKNQLNHMQCATHYFIGMLLIAATAKCRPDVKKKISGQGLEGNITVQLMGDVNYAGRACRVAAKYTGNSVDLYKLKVKKDGTTENNFIEGDEPTIETEIKNFFKK